MTLESGRQESLSESSRPERTRSLNTLSALSSLAARRLLTLLYNDFYQAIYGPENVFVPPEALLTYMEPLLLTTSKQLETLFVLWNAAQNRSPFEDAHAAQ